MLFLPLKSSMKTGGFCVHSKKNVVNLLFPPSLFPLSFPTFSAVEPTAAPADPVEVAGQNYPWNIISAFI